MAQFLRRFFTLAVNDLANQYAVPVKSITGYILSKYFASKTDFLNRATVERLNLSKGSKCLDDNVLELGYGRGNALGYCFDKVADGNGAVFGIDRSPYMEDCVRYRFALEIAETGKIRLDHAPDLRNLPYPSEVFNHILHVDFYYFIYQETMPYICKELYRVLKPGGTMVCGLSFNRLKRLSHWGLLEDLQWDPMRYMICLEPAGFVDVNIEYKPGENDKEYQFIFARKPEIDKACYDPERTMQELSLQIKKQMLISELIKTRRILTKEEQMILDEELPIGKEANLNECSVSEKQ